VLKKGLNKSFTFLTEMDDEQLNILSGKILDSAIEVHRNLGPVC